MSFRDIGLAVSKGLAGAAGDTATADRAQSDIDEGKLAKQQKLQMQIAPLSIALRGYQARYQDTLDEHGNVIPDKTHEAEAAKDAMSDIIGKIRHLVSPPPKEDPHGLGYLAHVATDKLHITRHAMEEAAARQKAKLDKYNQETKDTTNAVAAGTVPFALTPKGQEEGAKAKAAEALQKTKNEGAANRGNATRPVPYVRGAVNKSQAQDASKLGKVYHDENGDEIDTSKIPEDMFLLPIFGGGGKEWYELTTDPGRYETGDNRRKFEPSIGGPNPNAPDVGAVRVPTTRTSDSVDQFGVHTHSSSTSTPVNSGAANTTGQSSANPAPNTQGPKTQTLRKMQSGQSNSGPAPAKGEKRLDSQGNIPANAGNPMLVSAANELLHGKSQKDLQVPQKDKMAAADLARQYGYLGEGMWTPREQMQVNQSQELLNSLRKDKEFLSVYEEGPIKRAAIQTAIDKSKEHGIKANLARTLINMGLNEKDVRFVQSYQNLIGRIQGLALLTRGSGRPTEAAVNRMMQELPNVLTAQSAEEAQHAFDLIQNEIDIGMGGRKASGPKTEQLKETKSLSDRLNDALDGK